jgi:hypothetical protein
MFLFSPTFIPVDERLLDVSMPTLLNQTFPIGPFSDEDDSRYILQTNIAKPEDEIDKACQRILVLEPSSLC